MSVAELKEWISANFDKKEQIAGYVKALFFQRGDHQRTSNGTYSAGLPIILSSDGKIDASFIDDTDIDIATIIHAATGKTTPVNADELALVDSAASNVLKKLTWANALATMAATAWTWTASHIFDGGSGTGPFVTVKGGVSSTNPGLDVQKTSGSKLRFNTDGFGADTPSIYSVGSFDLAVGANSTKALTIDKTTRLVTFTSGISLGGSTISSFDIGSAADFNVVITGSTSNPTVTYTLQKLTYYKTNSGYLVQAQITINTISGGSGDARFYLPVAGNSQFNQVISATWLDQGVQFYSCTGYITASTAYATLWKGGGGVLAVTDLGAGDIINYGGFYLA